MPNWCECTLKIKSNDITILNNFINENNAGDINLSFNNLVPIPEEEEANWYQWNISNWGTKWDLNNETILDTNIDNKEYKYFFSTAWGPPLKWLSTVSSIYTDINFDLEYCEPGMNFAGKIIYKNEDILLNEMYSSSYYYWINNKDDIISDLINFVKENPIVETKIDYFNNLQLEIIIKACRLPDDINKLIKKFIDIKGKIIYDYILSNTDDINEFLEEDFYIYDSDILNEQILPCIKIYLNKYSVENTH
jgi:hypothetical protein